MSGKPSRAFNEKAAKHLFTVAVGDSRKSRKKDHTRETVRAIEAVRELAAEKDADVSVRSGGESMNRLGVFYLRATGSFARAVRELEGVSSVKRPETGAQKGHRRRPRGHKR